MWLQVPFESHFPFHYGLELSFNELLRVDQAEVGMILFFLWMSPTPRVEPSCNHSRGVLYSQLIWRISHLIFSVHPLQLNNDCDVVQRFSRHMRDLTRPHAWQYPQSSVGGAHTAWNLCHYSQMMSCLVPQSQWSNLWPRNVINNPFCLNSPKAHAMWWMISTYWLIMYTFTL